jgi:hypothetical protein
MFHIFLQFFLSGLFWLSYWRPPQVPRKSLENAIKEKMGWYEALQREDRLLLGVCSLILLDYRSKSSYIKAKIKGENKSLKSKEVSTGLEALSTVVKSYSNFVLLEVNQLCYGGILRTIALGATEGISSWKVGVLCSFQALVVPVGRCTLGRLFNVLGSSIDSFLDLDELPEFSKGETVLRYPTASEAGEITVDSCYVREAKQDKIILFKKCSLEGEAPHKVAEDFSILKSIITAQKDFEGLCLIGSSSFAHGELILPHTSYVFSNVSIAETELKCRELIRSARSTEGHRGGAQKESLGETLSSLFKGSVSRCKTLSPIKHKPSKSF